MQAPVLSRIVEMAIALAIAAVPAVWTFGAMDARLSSVEEATRERKASEAAINTRLRIVEQQNSRVLAILERIDRRIGGGK